MLFRDHRMGAEEQSVMSYGGQIPHHGGGWWLLREGADYASQLDLNR